MASSGFWDNKKVFLTGHTGFKGSWLCLWLSLLGAKVSGYALKPPTNPSLFELCKIDQLIDHNIGDIRDLPLLKKVMDESKPDIVIHMAAQPLVRESYKRPSETFEINVIGTVNLLEALRECSSVRAVVNVTTDKVYLNQEKKTGYKETDALGGFDPYSTSKACSELVTDSFRRSFFDPKEYNKHKIAVASARAGNVIGGGDWGEDRLVPDLMRCVSNNKTVMLRNPASVRPWQHVLEPLSGYMKLAEMLYLKGPEYGEAWNFGPARSDAKPVKWVMQTLISKWGKGAFDIDPRKHPHETNYLYLDSSKANKKLKWSPKWHIIDAIERIVDWNNAYFKGSPIRQFTIDQIKEYISIK